MTGLINPENYFNELNYFNEFTLDESIAYSENLPEMLVESLLPAGGVTLLAGEPGIGKTFFALSLAVSIGLNRPFFGLAINAGGRFGYVLGEGFRGFGRRVKKLKDKTGADNISDIGKVFVRQRGDLTDTVGQADLIEKLDQLQPRFIVFDTFSSLFHVTSENDNAEIAETLGFFDMLAQRYNAVVMLIHHISKVGKTVRGASAFIGNVDTVISLRQGISDPKEAERVKRIYGEPADRYFYASTEKAHGGKQKDEREYTFDKFRIDTSGLLINGELPDTIARQRDISAEQANLLTVTEGFDKMGITINPPTLD